MSTHARYGGVVPELASREHLRAIVPCVRLALEQSSTKLKDLAAIAVTQGPGLVGSLLVGMTYAKALCAGRKASADRGESYRRTHPRGAQPESRSSCPRSRWSSAAATRISLKYARAFVLPPARKDPRRCRRRGFRQGREAARVRLSRRPGDRQACAARRSPRGAFHARKDERQHARLQLQRNQDRGAALGGSARYGRRDRRAARAARLERIAHPPKNGSP